MPSINTPVHGGGGELGERSPDTSPARDSKAKGDGSGKPTPSGRTVLVVDDNVAAATMLALLLARLGAGKVETTNDGPSAVVKAKELRPDLILLDIGLPGMDGYQVARMLRGESDLGGVVLVALTGYGQEQDRLRSREAGFDEHLVKPASIDDLRRVLAMTR